MCEKQKKKEEKNIIRMMESTHQSNCSKAAHDIFLNAFFEKFINNSETYNKASKSLLNGLCFDHRGFHDLSSRIGNGISLGPEIGSKEAVCLAERVERRHDEVTASAGLSTSAGVDVLNTGELEHLLGDGGRNESSTTGSGNHADRHGAALTGDLHRNSVRFTDLVTPVSTANGNHVELGSDEGSLHGERSFLTNASTNADVAITIADDDVSLEAGALTGRSCLLHGKKAHRLLLQLSFGHEAVDNLKLLDGHGEEEDALKRGDLLLLDQASQLGARNPDLLFHRAATTLGAAATVPPFAIESSISSGSSSNNRLRISHDD